MAGGGGGYFGGTPSDSLMAFALEETGAARQSTQLTPMKKGPAAPEIAVSAKPLPQGDGRELVQQTCGGSCHDIATVTSRRMNRAEWSAVVDNMVARGAVAKGSQIRTIVDYLTQYLGR